jgi:hypothetical protein
MKARDFKKKFKVKSTPSVLPRNILNAETRRRGDAEKEKKKNSDREQGKLGLSCNSAPSVQATGDPTSR